MGGLDFEIFSKGFVKNHLKGFSELEGTTNFKMLSVIVKIWKYLQQKNCSTAEWTALLIVMLATIREKYLENDLFQGQGTVREFRGCSGNFRKDLKCQGI